MDADEWLREYAAELGLPAPDPKDVEILLELAGAAAHASQRPAAPIACYLVGSAGLDPSAALEIARRVADS